MRQQDIRPYGGRQYSVEEGAKIIEELDRRTKSGDEEYNSMQVLGERVKVAEGKADAAVSGYRGAISIEDVLTEDGIYTPTEVGTYPNAGGLLYALETTDEGLIDQFIKTGSEWVKNSDQKLLVDVVNNLNE